MIKINKTNYKQLIKGASLFTTGGGVSVTEQLKSIERLKGINVDVLPVTSLPKNSFLCTAGEVGPTNAPQIDKKRIIKNMISLLEQVSGKKIAGIYPPEIGQESIVLESAYYSLLPIADFDPSGFRAVPYLDINIFNLKNIPFSFVPLVVCNDQEELFIIEGHINYERTEKILRELTTLSKHGIIFYLGGIITTSMLIKHNLSTNSYSRAFYFGSVKNVNKLLKLLKPKIVLSGKVIDQKEKEQKGFLFQEIIIQSKERKYKLIILNEALFLYDNKNNLIASVPERILLTNPDKREGICSGDLQKGKEISVVIIDPEQQWQTEKAKKLFGIERFKSYYDK